MIQPTLTIPWAVYLEVTAEQAGLKLFYIEFPQGTEPQTYEYDCFSASTIAIYKTRAAGADATAFESIKASYRKVGSIDEVQALTPQAVSGTGALMVERQTKSGKLGFNQWTLCSINFCKKTTWYQHYDQNTDVVCTADGEYKVYDSSITNWINIEDFTLAIQDYNRGGPSYGLAGVFQRDGTLAQRESYWPTIKVNDVVRTSGYTINYADGKVTFAEALQSGDVVKATFRSVKTAGGSEFIVRPLLGHKFVIPHVEINASVDMKLTAPVLFEVWAGDPNYSFQGEAYYLQYIMKYRSWQQLVGIGVVGMDRYEAWGGSDVVAASAETGWCPNQKAGLQHEVVEIPYDFGLEWGKAIELDSTYYTQLRIRLPSETQLAGEYATATFYVEDTLV